MSLIKVKSGGVWGIEGYRVDVEVDVSPGLPSFNLVGLPDTAVKESKERVRSAIKNLGYGFPQKRITVNLSPSNIRKQGTLYDLPIALGLLFLGGYLPGDLLEDSVFLGELSLDGSIRKVVGALPIVVSLKGENVKRFFLPVENAVEASFIEGVEVYGVANLGELIGFLRGEVNLKPIRKGLEELLSSKRELDIDMGEVLGQVLVKRALEISAAGGHNLSMVGSPGSGKSMLAKRMQTILPPMDFDEIVEVSRIYSVAGELGGTLITQRPFRSPHHTASEAAIIGGGSVPSPGEASLAHKGVLFLDELPEFPRKTLEALRQPIEDGYVNISRAQGKVRFPAEFTLVTAQNPCPCGNYGDPFKQCSCSPSQIRSYTAKVSQPIKDRIDLHVWVEPVDKGELLKNKKGESSKTIRERVLKAYLIQKERFKNSKTAFNGRMSNREVELYCINMMDSQAKTLLKNAMDKLNLSGRSYFKVLKVSRTIADLEQEENIKAHHVAEALQFRGA